MRRADKVEKVLQQAAKVLASNTELCNDGFRTGQQPEHIEVHSAITGG